MTQASLSASESQDARGALGSEAALWLFGLTALSLVLAALMLLGLLSQRAVGDPAVGGFMIAIAVTIAVIGVAGVAYVLSVAKRAGHFDTDDVRPGRWRDNSVETAGLHVEPAVPIDLGPSKRRELAAERTARRQQARAIATAEEKRRNPPPVTSPAPVRPPAQVRAPAVAIAAARPTAPVRRAAAPAPARQAATRVPVRQMAVPTRHTVSTPPPVRMAAPGRVPPPIRMPAPLVRPRTHAALAQLANASTRAGWMPRHPRPLPPAIVGRG